MGSWVHVETLPLPMGDTYVVSSRGKLLHGVRHKKTGEVSDATCLTNSRSIIREYYELARQVDNDTLRGLNPYLSAEGARLYRDSRRTRSNE